MEEYRKTRGFLLEPYERWTPGDKARNISELIWALDEALNNPDKWKKEREWLRDVMFKYQDGKSSERIIKYFWGDV
ncbi:CDP-glycerol glycerophosphotransferase family protein [Thermococcus sp.]|uniref:CDP-glycerol glycerophosphotransferase family protein n=1 Tax=Thermococcus sp. TaxID=35749 RepID=UPI003448D7F8